MKLPSLNKLIIDERVDSNNNTRNACFNSSLSWNPITKHNNWETNKKHLLQDIANNMGEWCNPLQGIGGYLVIQVIEHVKVKSTEYKNS